MRAWLNLRYTLVERRKLFHNGLKRHGYQVMNGVTENPGDKDIFVTWNRIRQGDKIARLFEKRGLKVLVTENATWGNTFAGHDWYTIGRNHHNTAGRFDYGGPERWGNLNVPLSEWRTSGETVILPQRGIGSDPVRMPPKWVKTAHKEHGGRIRSHPGKREVKPLAEDLSDCGHVVTWGSGAAIKALMWGIPVTSYMPSWIGEQDNTTEGRLEMLRRLAWAQWTHNEIASGEAFDKLLIMSR